jgi:uncharacterized protein with GYD domain
MPTYITLLNFTQQGMENIKDGPNRVERARQAIRAAGGEMTGFYLTMGRYDAIAITEAPSDEAHARVVLGLAAAGNVRTETLRAFTEEEYRDIVAGLP